MENESSMDLVINEYKKDIDETLIIENLKLSYTERIQKLQNLLIVFEDLQKAKKNHD